jgi:hypothetical protein
MRKLLSLLALAAVSLAHAQWVYNSGGTSYSFTMRLSAGATGNPGVPQQPVVTQYVNSTSFYWTAQFGWQNFNPWGQNTLSFSGSIYCYCTSTGYGIPPSQIQLDWSSAAATETAYLAGNTGEPWLSTPYHDYTAYYNAGPIRAAVPFVYLALTSSKINAAGQWVGTYASNMVTFDSGSGGCSGIVNEPEVELWFASGGYGAGGSLVPTVTLG